MNEPARARLGAIELERHQSPLVDKKQLISHYCVGVLRRVESLICLAIRPLKHTITNIQNKDLMDM